MDLVPNVKGKIFSYSRPFQLTAGKITRFSKYFGDNNSLYSGAASFAPPIFSFLPALYPLTVLLSGEDLKAYEGGVGCMSKEVNFKRLLSAGDEVFAKAEIKDATEVQGGLSLVVALNVFDDEDEEIISGVGRYMLFNDENERASFSRREKPEEKRWRKEVFSSTENVTTPYPRRLPYLLMDAEIEKTMGSKKVKKVCESIFQPVYPLALLHKSVVANVLGNDPARLKTISLKYARALDNVEFTGVSGGWLPTPEEWGETNRRLLGCNLLTKSKEDIVFDCKTQVI